MATKTTTTTDKTELVSVDDLNTGDEILLEDKWRKFELASDSRHVKHHVNIMVKTGTRRFFRIHEDAKIERRVKESK